MVAVTNKRLLSLAICMSVLIYSVERSSASSPADIDASYQCSKKIESVIGSTLGFAPSFSTIRQLTTWVRAEIPRDLGFRVEKAGDDVAKTMKLWQRENFVYSPFYNLQALNELILRQSKHFVGFAGCDGSVDDSVIFQILQDQLIAPLGLDGNDVKSEFVRFNISDPHYIKLAILYGIILDSAEIPWTDEQLSNTVKFQLANCTSGGRFN